jgi:plasmid maintenance system antidote protein VapI
LFIFVKNIAMEAKLRQLMKHEGVNSTRLAEILGIQASGISHIMSGRNKPSYDFLLKLLQRFPQINPDWLLLDRGPMYRDEIKNKTQNATAGSATTTIKGVVGAASGMGGGSSSGSGAGSNVGSGGGSDVGSNVGSGGFEWPTARNHAGSGIQTAVSGASKGLFGPDNDDIIQSTTQQAAAQSAQPVLSAQPQPLPQQHSEYQRGGFARSASIERIVVFYKDKTFSEYQPE